MQLGRIVGTVIASQKDEKLEGLRMHLVRNLVSKPGAKGGFEESSAFVVAIDSVGAGIGEVVLYATGSSARQTAQTKDRPCDAVIMAIVDQIETTEGSLYSKAGS
jgi:microcompartment protein CcmK/EutM